MKDRKHYRWYVEEHTSVRARAADDQWFALGGRYSVTIEGGDVVCWMEPTASKRVQLHDARELVRLHNRAAGYIA